MIMIIIIAGVFRFVNEAVIFSMSIIMYGLFKKTNGKKDWWISRTAPSSD